MMAGIAVASLGQFADVFFPQILVERVIRHRLVVVYQPLFSGYIFVHTGDDLLRNRIGHTRGVGRIVLAGTQPGLIRDEVISAMKAQQEGNAIRLPIELPTQFAAGQSVGVIEGPFQGKVGIIESMTKADRVKVLFSLFGGHVAADFPVRQVELSR